MFNGNNSKRKKISKYRRGAIVEENIAVIYLLLFFLCFPMIDLAMIAVRTFFLWFACEQGAMAGAKGTVWSTSTYKNNYYTCIQTQAINTANKVISMFSGVTVTSGPTLTVIAQAIPNTSGATINPYSPSTSTYLDKSLYVPLLQVSMTGKVQPFITIPFIPGNIPGLNAPFTINVSSEQQIENITALSY